MGDTILDPLGRLLDRCPQTPPLLASAAPYGQIYQILLDPSHPAWSVKPEILLVWTTPQLTLPSVAKLLRFEFESAAAEYDKALCEVEQFAEAVLSAAARIGLVFVATWAVPPHER